MSDPDEAFSQLIDAMAEAVLDLRWSEEGKDANLSCGMTEEEWHEDRSVDKSLTMDEMAAALFVVLRPDLRSVLLAALGEVDRPVALAEGQA